MKKKIMILVLLLTIITITGCKSNKIESCTNCVYSSYEKVKNIGKNGSILKKYENNYKKLDRKIFLGHKLDKNNKIVKGYVCGIENKKAFCLEGNYNGSKYNENKSIVKKIYPKGKCQENVFDNGKYYICSGKINVTISERGTIYISTSKSDGCYINKEGTMHCYA